jgi:hypothetical protein
MAMPRFYAAADAQHGAVEVWTAAGVQQAEADALAERSSPIGASPP